ncbi:MAG: chromate efflux transporter [Hyphomicrobiaceae bacterium]
MTSQINAARHEGAVTPAPTFTEALGVWARIGLISFGGPAGQIALMHRVLVEERKWIDERAYLQALNFCMLLPGPEAMQLATYVGWRLHGTLGGLAAGLLFVLPGALVILVLAALYAIFGTLPLAVALLVGIKAAVLAIVVEALIRIARRGLTATAHRWLAAIAFIAIFLLGVPFPLIVLAAALYGFATGAGPVDHAPRAAPPVSLAATLRTAAVWLAIWLVPLAMLAMLFGSTHVIAQLGLLFSKLAVVTFGGAYAVLAYLAQAAVQHYGWLVPGEMVDALGFAETTPGPLILVNEFVGFLAAYRHGGGPPLLMGSLGALVALWATFAPCFLWIFVGAPYIERINAEPRLRAALAAVTAAVVGVILNLTVWFALNVLFHESTTTWYGPLRLYLPSASTLDPVALVLTLVAFALLFRLHRGIMTTLTVCGAFGVAWHLLAG